MKFIADFHIHSYLSRATSKECNLEYYAKWAKVKGINLIGTGDFTHPKWFNELKDKLVEAEAGLFKLKEEPKLQILNNLTIDTQDVRFILTVEVSSIYKKGNKVRKVHNLIFAPDLITVQKINKKLSSIGNLEADGRPIIGLDSKQLLEIVLSASEEAFIIPAHIWTPWFSILGSKSGFDSIEECFEDLSKYIFALETGLSSDPNMNWLISKLDKYTLISNSDAHSPAKLGREANIFDTEMNYFSIKQSIKTKKGFIKTVEFYPEEGKYHFDGHRNCGVRLSPQETKELNNICPVCGREITIGVMNRVIELADRDKPIKPPNTPDFINLVPLNEVIAKVYDISDSNTKIWQYYNNIIAKFQSEFDFLMNVPIDQIQTNFDSLLAEGIKRVREGKVKLLPGYDGEYGQINIFDPEERDKFKGNLYLFELKENPKKQKSKDIPSLIINKDKLVKKENTLQIKLNEQQQQIINCEANSILIKAGPGTGKTKTLIEKIVYLLNKGVIPANILVITFTNKAANEVKERLNVLPHDTKQINLGTFHSIGFLILKENSNSLLNVINEEYRYTLLPNQLSLEQKKEILDKISKYKQSLLLHHEIEDNEYKQYYEIYQNNLEKLNLLDYDDLILKPVKLLELDEYKRKYYQERFKYIFIDEYQDINYAQYKFIKLLYSQENSIFAIGDPDQAIYGFRGADYKYFLNFSNDFINTKEFVLNQNYRSSQKILDAAFNVIKNNNSNTKLIANKSVQGEVLHINFDTPKQEAKYIVKVIKEVIGGLDLLTSNLNKSISFKDIGILYRINAIKENLINEIQNSGIPYRVVGEDSIFNKKGIREVIDILKAATYNDNLAIAEIIKLPQFKLCKSNLEIVTNLLYEGKTLKELLKPQSISSEYLSGLKGILPPKEIDKLKEVYEFLERVKENINNRELNSSIEELFKIFTNNLNEEQRRFLQFINNFNNVQELLEYINLYPYSEYEQISEKVSLMTLHASKGLEFEVIFIVGAEEGLLPYTLANDIDIEEERRLFYVGLTRAKSKVICTSTSERNLYGKVIKNKVSRFIEEIGDLIESKSILKKYKNKPTQLSLFGI